MTVTIEQQDWIKVLAEIVGTFFFFFIGIGSGLVALELGSLGVFYVALAHGVALSLAISTLGHISGAHFNPAVTISLAIVRKINPLLAVLYILGQLLGGVLACLALLVIMPFNVLQAGTPGLNAGLGIGIWQGIFVEAILTLFLVLAIFGTVVDPRANRIAGFGIGLTVFVDILVGGPLTGAAMNPARAIAPAIVAGSWHADWYVYWIGPIIGGIGGALIYNYLFMPRGDEPVIVAPAVTDQPLEPPISEPGLIKD